MRLVAFACVLLACTLAHAESHRRLVTEGGVVHVWTPDGYDPDTAGVVVYLHGYYTTVDKAWSKHRLRKQFAASKINALFIACATPDGPRPEVAWPRLELLLSSVQARIGELPAGRRVAVAHSGGHRTLSSWLRDPALDTVVLLDALYDDGLDYLAWIEASEDRRLIDVAVLTREWTDRLHAVLASTFVIDKLDDPRAREARIVYLRSDVDHMKLITGGRVLPRILRMLALPTVNKPHVLPSSLM